MPETMNRRDFLKTGAAGMAGSAFLAACSRSAPQKQSQERKLIYRTLGRTGLRLPVVSMGSAYAVDLVRAAHAEGIVYIHTSSSYSERNHERLLGAALRDLPRDSFVIASGPDLPYQLDRGRDLSLDLGTGTDPGLIPKSLEGSLQRLGLGYVDIYYFCSIGRRETALHEPYLKAFEQLKTSGKARFLGIGTHANEPEVIRAAAESRFWDVVLTAYNFRQSHREDVRAAIGEAAQAGLGVVAMKTQAGVYWDRTRRKINMKAALKWVLQDENVHTAIPAFSNYEEMQEDLSIMDNLALTPEERQDLRLGEEMGLSGMYCQQCGRCRAQCPAEMDIPLLMRAAMYAFGHERPERARHMLRAWTPADVPCRRCAGCDVRCKLGLDVRSSALAVALLLDGREEISMI